MVFLPVSLMVITEDLPTSLPVPAVVGTAYSGGSLFIIFIIGKHNLASIWFSKRKLKTAILLITSVWIISQLFIITFSYSLAKSKVLS